MGDLLAGQDGRCLVLDMSGRGGSGSLVKLISETGRQMEEEYDDLSTGYTFSHNSGLRYPYAGRRVVEQDFATGLFKPYFEIL